MFTIYENDLLTVPTHYKSACYVDDRKLYLSFPSPDTDSAITNMNNDLRNICSWCLKNYLVINADKTKLLLIREPQRLRHLNPTVSINALGKIIDSVPVAKDLGVLVDQSLTYNEHVNGRLISRLINIFNT